MNFLAADRKQFTVDVVCGLDLTNATAWLVVDDIPHEIAWTTSANHQADGLWARTGHSDYFAGPAVPAGSVGTATVLALGTHRWKLRVTAGSNTVNCNLVSFQVR